MQNYAIRECFSRVVSFRLFQCLAAKLGGAIFLLLLIDAPSVWLLISSLDSSCLRGRMVPVLAK